ncbi:TadE/TadG family type IV pilus assembly protein [Paraburkholderia hospita]|uniref:TadE/TadG family type IV pilus assembly protein n=1 Tax=Paraburkholderia hospita TaxID=169430 RepID=UPI0002715FFB|nr:TadE/TadG family type IV pilus assembly protein [Paraburkholderia hospita]AXF02472.1 pilus assembly protein TadE [Paraburkholderia hospita]EUC18986.1 TadE family protein [Burkholderia sp. BT03]SKC65572.1 TadE-like protein [Paraburkholderia hospita]
MKTRPRLKGRRYARGNAKGIVSVEFALLLPLLLGIALPLYDIARNIQAQMILINVSREGANLSSRAAATYPMQTIMSSLASTTPPLNMSANGMIYITQIMGSQGCDAKGNGCTGTVVAQWKWTGGSDGSAASKIWNCSSAGTSWATDGSGACNGLGGKTPAQAVDLLKGKLSDGQIAYAVESFYVQQPLIGAINLGGGITTPALSPNLYSMSVF